MLNVKLKTILLFITILISTNLHSKILDKDEARQADLSTLQEEISLFQSISLGISLSLAHCDNNENCSLPMEEKEIQQLLDTIESRIDSLAKRQTEIDDIIGFNKVLSAYEISEIYNSSFSPVERLYDNLSISKIQLNTIGNKVDNFSVASEDNDTATVKLTSTGDNITREDHMRYHTRQDKA